MTTINTVDDFLKALDDNPSWLEAVRARILGEELRQLPVRFDAFVEEQRAFSQEMRGAVEEIRATTKELRAFNEEQRIINEEQRAFNQEIRGAVEEIRATTKELRAFNEEQRIINEEQRAFNQEIRATTKELRAFNEEQRVINEEQRAANEEQKTWNRNTTDRFNRMEGDMSTFKDYYVSRQPFNDAHGIAGDFGLEFVRVLAMEDLSRMGGSSLPRDVHRSFRNADLVIEGTDESGGVSYIVIEVSYTADRRDTDRAIRNAELITRFTGRPAQPVIASMRNDYAAQELVESGAVHWYEVRDHAGRDKDAFPANP